MAAEGPRRDHLLIAGTYTPFCLLALDGPWRAWLLAGVWLSAAVGILVKIHRVDLHVLSGVLYWGSAGSPSSRSRFVDA